MKKVKEQLGDDVCHDLLFLHAILGCDTTSRVHGIGKAAALKKYANSLHFREQAKVFNSPSTVDDIVVAGENALVSLYGGKPGEKLDGMRYQRYCEKLATNSSQIQPQNLPPTSAAARHRSLRVYLQVKQWKGENEGMSLEDYGWKVTEGQVLPTPRQNVYACAGLSISGLFFNLVPRVFVPYCACWLDETSDSRKFRLRSDFDWFSENNAYHRK